MAETVNGLLAPGATGVATFAIMFAYQAWKDRRAERRVDRDASDSRQAASDQRAADTMDSLLAQIPVLMRRIETMEQQNRAQVALLTRHAQWDAQVLSMLVAAIPDVNPPAPPPLFPDE